MKRALASLVLAMAVLAAAPTRAQTSLEYEVKGAYLYKFAPFIEWPAALNAGPLVLCIVGADPFGASLDRAVAAQPLSPRQIEIRRMARADAGCHVMFLAGSREQSVADGLRAVAGQPVLTVTDGASPARGIIHFVVVQRRVRFMIDPAAAARAGLKPSSKLLDLAVRR